MGYISIILGFALLIYLSMKNVSVFIGGVLAAFVIIFMNSLPVVDTLTNVYYKAFGGIFTSFFPMFLFGAILAKIYASSGAAVTISDAICARLFDENASPKKKFTMAFLTVIVASAVLCYGGINSGVAIVTIYPIALRIFEKANIPKKFIMGAICGGAFTFALCGPGSPQLTNVAAMSLGTSSTCGLTAGILAIIAEVAVMVVLLSHMSIAANARGECFAYGPKDTVVTEDSNRPGFIMSLIPLVFLLVIFNIFQVNIIIATMLATLLAAVMFFKYMGIPAILESCSEGTVRALVPCGCMGSVVGFAAVVQATSAFQVIIDKVLNMNVAPILLVILSVAFICSLTGGSVTGLRIALPIISPALLQKGLTAELIHRVGAFASTTIDSLPHSGAIIMAVSMADLKMKDGYPAVFVTTVIATISGTIVAAVTMSLFPFLP